eukprot:gene46954-58577_t
MGNGLGDGGQATSASLKAVEQIYGDTSNQLFVADRTGWKVRKLDLMTGILTMFAGTGVSGTNTDGTGPATSVPVGVVIGVYGDTSGVIYISTYNTNRVKIVTPSGNMSTVAGFGGATGTAS